jgi:hypothetical protein
MDTHHLSLSNPVYTEIEEKVRKTYPNSCILWVEELKNPELYQRYEKYKNELDDPNEKMLFHGTTERAARSILARGFAPSLNKRSAYGMGVYFAKAASYSKGYSRAGRDQIAFLLFCNVALGRSAPGRTNQEIPKGYNSFADNPKDPSICVVNKTEAAYPRYLIAFHPNAK